MNSRQNIAMRLVAPVLLLAAQMSAPVAQAEVSGHIALTSEYIYRGLSWSSGNPAVQAGVDYEHQSGLFAGIWASTVDLSNPTGRRDVELNYYAGYSYNPDTPFSASASLIRYTYPDDSSAFDYDFTEAQLTASWSDNYSLELGYTDNLYGFDESSYHAELRANRELRSAWIVSGGLGYNDVGALAQSNYLYWDVGASARYSRVVVDLRWYDNESPGGFLDRLSAGSQIVGTVTFIF